MDRVLGLSEAASLALHAMAYLAANPGRRVSTQQVADVLCASRAHLSKVLQRLSKAGLVASLPGPGGGFVLENGSEATSLLDIYEIIEGPLTPRSCLLGHPICRGEKCILGGLVERLGEQVRSYLAGTRVSDLSRVFRRNENGPQKDRED